MEKQRIFIQHIFQGDKIPLGIHQHIFIRVQFLQSQRTRPIVELKISIQYVGSDTYLARVNWAFQNGLTNREKYRARPSRLPLKIAEPPPSPRLFSSSAQTYIQFQKRLTGPICDSFCPHWTFSEIVECLSGNRCDIDRDIVNRAIGSLFANVQESVATCYC